MFLTLNGWRVRLLIMESKLDQQINLNRQDWMQSQDWISAADKIARHTMRGRRIIFEHAGFNIKAIQTTRAIGLLWK